MNVLILRSFMKTIIQNIKNFVILNSHKYYQLLFPKLSGLIIVSSN